MLACLKIYMFPFLEAVGKAESSGDWGRAVFGHKLRFRTSPSSGNFCPPQKRKNLALQGHGLVCVRPFFFRLTSIQAVFNSRQMALSLTHAALLAAHEHAKSSRNRHYAPPNLVLCLFLFFALRSYFPLRNTYLLVLLLLLCLVSLPFKIQLTVSCKHRVEVLLSLP